MLFPLGASHLTGLICFITKQDWPDAYKVFARDFFGSKFEFGAIDGIYIFSNFNSYVSFVRIKSYCSHLRLN